MPEELRALVRRVVDTMGRREASLKLGISRGTVASVLAGFEVQAGSLAMLREALARESGPEPPDEVA